MPANVEQKTSSNLSKDAVHDPVDAGGTDAVGCADAALLQMFHDALDERQLNVLGILDMELLSSLLAHHDDGLVGEDREVEPSVVAYEFDAVGACALVTYKAPTAAARKAVGKLEGSTDGVLRLIKSAAIAAETFGFDDGAEDFLKQVNLVRRKVVEVTAACNVALYTPGKGCAVVVEVAWRAGKAYLHGRHLTDGSALYQFLYLLEVRQVASVICHETRDVRLFADAVDALAVEVAAGKRLLYIDWLARLHRHDSIGGVGGRRCGDVDGIDVGVSDELLGIVVPTGNVVPLGIRVCLLLVAAHHGLYARTGHKVERRSALLLCNFTATDEAPTDFFIYRYRCRHLVKEVPAEAEMYGHGVDGVVRHEEGMAGACVDVLR